MLVVKEKLCNILKKLNISQSLDFIGKLINDCWFLSSLEELKLMKSNKLWNCFPVHKALPVITLSKSYELLKEGEEFEVTCLITDVDSSVQTSWIAHQNVVSSFNCIMCISVHSTQTLCRHSHACLGYLMLFWFGFVAFTKIQYPTDWWEGNNRSVPMRMAGRKNICMGFSSQKEIKVRLFNVKFRWPLLGFLNTEAWSAYTSHCNQWELQISTHGLQITYSSCYH